METLIIKANSAHLSDDQFFELCIANKEIHFERDKHKNIIIMAPTGANTGNKNLDISWELVSWNKKHKLGYCFDSSSGFTLPDGSVISPDASWIAKEKWDKIDDYDKDRFAPICPDFIIEVRSRTDILKQLKEKMNTWISNGCRLAWLIDLENKTTYVYRPEKEATEHPFTDTLSGEDVLPDFELKLSDILS